MSNPFDLGEVMKPKEPFYNLPAPQAPVAEVKKKFSEHLHDASFDGISFYIDSHSAEFGHRYSSNALPFKKDPENQELGKSQRSYNITGYILGDDYFDSRDKLIKSVEDGGNRELVHPYFGRISVVCVKVSVAETVGKGRFCALDMQFLEDSRVSPPVAIDKIAAVEEAANKTKISSLNAFRKAFNYISKLAKTVQSKIRDAQFALKGIVDEIKAIENLAGDIAQIASDLITVMRNVSEIIDRVVAFPNLVANLISDICTSFESALSGLKKSVDGALKMVGLPGLFSKDSKNFKESQQELKKLTKEERADIDKKRLSVYKKAYSIEVRSKSKSNFNDNILSEENRNQHEMQKLIQTHILSSACVYAVKSEFVSIADANKIREELVSKIDELMSDTTIDVEVFTSLYNLRSATYEAMTSIVNEIPQIKHFKVEPNQSIINFCFDNFNNLDVIDDIISLNDISNPAELNAGEELAVIYDDRIKSRR